MNIDSILANKTKKINIAAFIIHQRVYNKKWNMDKIDKVTSCFQKIQSTPGYGLCWDYQVEHMNTKTLI